MKDRIQQLEKELAELKAELSEEEFEEGQWYVIETVNPWLKRVENIDGLKIYGPSMHLEDGGWISGYLHKHRIKSARPATSDEIKEALIAEAKRRGLVKGAKARQRHDEYGKTIEDRLISDKYEYDSSRDALYVRSETMIGMWVYRRGQWAEKIEDTPSIEVNGYTAEFHEDYVEFGCARIDKRFFTDMMMEEPWDFEGGGNGNRTMTGIKIGEGVFTVEQIKEIAEYYQSKS